VDDRASDVLHGRALFLWVTDAGLLPEGTDENCVRNACWRVGHVHNRGTRTISHTSTFRPLAFLPSGDPLDSKPAADRLNKWARSDSRNFGLYQKLNIHNGDDFHLEWPRRISHVALRQPAATATGRHLLSNNFRVDRLCRISRIRRGVS